MSSQSYAIGSSLPPQNNTSQSAAKGPQTLFQLLVMLAKSFAMNMVWRVVFSVITFIVVFLAHTYLMVVVNDTLRVVEQNKVMAMIINLVPIRPETPAVRNLNALNIYLFWILLSNITFGTVARIITFGIKQFFIDIADMFSQLIKSIFAKAGNPSLTKIFQGSVLGLLAGIFLLNNAVCLALAAFLVLSVSQREKSFLVLVSTLTKSDFQRLFRVKNRMPLNIDVFSIVTWGAALGLLIAGIIPPAIFGKSIISTIIKSIFLIAVILLGGLNAAKKGPVNLMLFIASAAAYMFFLESTAFADDTGWTESGKNLSGWLKNTGTPQALKLGLPPSVLSALAIALGSGFPKFMAGLAKNPNMNVDDYIKTHMSNSQQQHYKEALNNWEQRRNELRENQKFLEKMMEARNKQARIMDWLYWGARTTQTVADVSIDVLSNVTGPAGKSIKTAYTFGKGVAGGVGEATADPANWKSNMVKGVVNGVTDVVKDKIGDKFGQDNPLTGSWAKGGATIVIETGKGALESGLKGEDITKGAISGFGKGTVDAVVSIGGDHLIPPKNLPDVDLSDTTHIILGGGGSPEVTDAVKEGLKGFTKGTVTNVAKGDDIPFTDWKNEATGKVIDKGADLVVSVFK